MEQSYIDQLIKPKFKIAYTNEDYKNSILDFMEKIFYKDVINQGGPEIYFETFCLLYLIVAFYERPSLVKPDNKSILVRAKLQEIYDSEMDRLLREKIYTWDTMRTKTDKKEYTDALDEEKKNEYNTIINEFDDWKLYNKNMIKFINDPLSKPKETKGVFGFFGGSRSEKSSNERFYTVVSSSVGNIGGRYASKSGPAAAAKKAATKRFTGASDKTRKMRIVIRQTKTKKEMVYEATRTKLNKPITRTVAGVKVVKSHKIEIKAVKSI